MNNILAIIFFATIVFSFNGSANAQDVNIPDANFKAYLVGNAAINTNRDSEIQISEADAFNGTIFVDNQNISDLSGIEAFVALTELYCSNNNLTSLDVRSNTALTSLVCYSNLLENIDVSRNVSLIYFLCSDNQLSSLDVTNNTLLETLWCRSNLLTVLDLNQNTLISNLICSDNFLSSLDLSSNALLETLWCYSNSISSLDVSNNTNLSELNCYSNGMQELDISANTTLVHLDCSSNLIGSLDISSSTALESLNCSKNSLTNLNLITNTGLTTLNCDYNSLVSLDLRNNIALNTLSCRYNRLMILDVRNGHNDLLTTFDANNNSRMDCINVSDVDHAIVNWTNIDTGVSFNTDCPVYIPDPNFKLYLVGNSYINTNGDDEIQLSEAAVFSGMIDAINLDISDLTGIEAFPLITGLDCSMNLLNRVDARYNGNLTHLVCSDNPLKNLDICNGNNSSITTFKAVNTPNLSCISVDDVAFATTNWTDIDPGVSFNIDCAVDIPDINLKAYLVSNTDINTNGDDEIQYSEAEVFNGDIHAEELGITDMTGIEAFTAISYLDCGRNALSSLDVSQNIGLQILRCDGNSLTSLDVSANKALINLYCRSNSISTLDVSNNLNLTDLNFGINSVTSIDVSANIALRKFICNENSISSLDVSNNTDLIYLFCDHNSIGSLDISKNTALTRLHCGNNPLNSLDLSNNVALVSLQCYENSLSSLDVSNNTALTSMSCANNSLNSLNVSTNLNLRLLYCFNNTITDLDLKNHSALELLLCNDNSLKSLDMRNGKNSDVIAFNATNNPDLTCISVSDVAYATANWTNIDPGVGFSTNCGFQDITFGPLADKTFGEAEFTLSATSSSGLAVSYSSSNTLVAVISDNMVSIVGAGSTTITASQYGDAYYDGAMDVDQVLTINKASQTINFDPLENKTYSDADFSMNATSSSGLAVSYASSNKAVAEISGNIVTIVGVGSATITASQAGSANYDPAVDVDQVLIVKKANQSITFEALKDMTYGDADISLNASSSSGLSVSYKSSNASVVKISGNSLTIVGAGDAIISASQSGDDNYNAATIVEQMLTVKKANQTITFELPEERDLNEGDFMLAATATSELPVAYSSSNASVATILENTVTIIGPGSTILTASQPGDANYNKADDVDQELSIIITSLVDEISKTDIVIFPNPAQNYLYLKAEHIEQINSLSIIDNAGKIIIHQKELHEHINVSGLRNGLYHIVIEVDHVEIKEKFIIER